MSVLSSYPIAKESYPDTDKGTVAMDTMSDPVRIPSWGAGIVFIPGAGCTGRVFKSLSGMDDILADIADASLSYANLIAGTQPTLSRWMLWASGAVTVDTWQSPAQSAGDTAIIATATGGAGVLEVTR